MKKTIILGLLSAATVVAVSLAPLPSALADQTLQQEEKQQKKQPFNGKVDAVDPTVQTLTVGGKVIYISAKTQISRGGQSIQLTDIKVGEDVHGQTQMTFDGKTEALTVKVGPPEQK
jgi:hypothetical protein